MGLFEYCVKHSALWMKARLAQIPALLAARYGMWLADKIRCRAMGHAAVRSGNNKPKRAINGLRDPSALPKGIPPRTRSSAG